MLKDPTPRKAIEFAVKTEETGGPAPGHSPGFLYYILPRNVPLAIA